MLIKKVNSGLETVLFNQIIIFIDIIVLIL